ncbi:MAG: histidine--tRNA ligase [Nitrospira sp.]|nr:histidine--tRNA ligase [Nitrospira sp.]MDE0485718.1 histidine--tRNA ligase [Nitrospira sp.]
MIRGIKGIKDIIPDEMPKWSVVERMAHALAHAFGFHEIRIPVFERTDLFVHSIGGSTDIVEKEMYTFPDKDGTSLTLRPEGTAGVVRAFIERGLKTYDASRKLYYIGPMFRHERPQAGRLRQFHQFGVEYVGTSDPSADVEVVTLLWRYFSALQLPGLSLELNSLGVLADRQAYKKDLVSFLKTKSDLLCGNCRRRLDVNPLRALDCKVPTCHEATNDAPFLTDFLSASSKEHFDRVLQGLQALAIPYSLNPRLVRGLDYYSMTTFEVSCSALGAQNAIGGGGRYDGLFETLGGVPTPAVGFAIGLERVILALPESALPAPDLWVFVAAFGEKGRAAGNTLIDSLRSNHMKADTDYHASTLKTLLRSADRLNAPYVVIIGDDEVANNHVILRNMATKEQQIHPLDAASSAISERLGFRKHVET